jgi:protein-disulfide isomerase
MNVLLTAAAVVIAGTVVFRQVRAQDAAPAATANSTDVTKVKDWTTLVNASRAGSDSAAPVTVVVFTDFQCPACKRFHSTLHRLRAEMRDTFTVRYVHFPLDQHEQAAAAASLFECSRNAVDVHTLADTLYASQDSLGSVPWHVLARRVNTSVQQSKLEACMRDTVTVNQVRAHMELGAEIGVAYTPTILVNGWKLSGTPGTVAMARYIRAAAQSLPLDSLGPTAGR